MVMGKVLCWTIFTIPSLFMSLHVAAQPVDPDFDRQWYLENNGQVIGGVTGIAGADIDVVSAWAVFDGAENVIVAIVSTGVDPHPEFANRLLEGVSFVGDPFSSLDDCGVGTHMAGVVGAALANVTGPNGIIGVCPTVHLLPIRVANGCQLNLLATAQGITWAVDHGADIIVTGAVFTSGQGTLLQAIDYAASQDVMVIAPAGNARDNSLAFPAAYANCVSVSCTTNVDTLTNFSNFGVGLDVAAPGEGIFSSWLGSNYVEVVESGHTAAALAAGTAALLKSYNPTLTSPHLRQLITTSAESVGDPMFFGSGRICTGCAMQQTPVPTLRFEHNLSRPSVITPNTSSTTTVQLVEVSELADVDQVFLHYRIGQGLWRVSPMRHLVNDVYELRWPAAPCESTIAYYLSAQSVSGVVILDPPDAPMKSYTVQAQDRIVLFEDDFESNKGWIAIDATGSAGGLWERVVPVGTSAQPAYDASVQTGTLCYVTGQHIPGQSIGANDVDGGPVELWSPDIPISSRNIELSFSCWVESSGLGVPDDMFVEVSVDDGQSWLAIAQISSTSGWVHQTYSLRGIVGFVGLSMRVRFSIADSDASLTEAAVDDVQVQLLSCSSASHDANQDGRVDLADFDDFLECLVGPQAFMIENACNVFDVFGMFEVDLHDFSAFQRRFNPVQN